MRFQRDFIMEEDAIKRLIGMGLLQKSGEADLEAIDAFARIYSGLFFWETEHTSYQEKHLMSAYLLLRELDRKADYEQMYLVLAIQYDNMKRPLPEAVWWLFHSKPAVSAFMHYFVGYFDAYMSEHGRLPAAEGG